VSASAIPAEAPLLVTLECITAPCSSSLLRPHPTPGWRQGAWTRPASPASRTPPPPLLAGPAGALGAGFFEPTRPGGRGAAAQRTSANSPLSPIKCIRVRLAPKLAGMCRSRLCTPLNLVTLRARPAVTRQPQVNEHRHTRRQRGALRGVLQLAGAVLLQLPALRGRQLRHGRKVQVVAVGERAQLRGRGAVGAADDAQGLRARPPLLGCRTLTCARPRPAAGAP